MRAIRSALFYLESDEHPSLISISQMKGHTKTILPVCVDESNSISINLIVEELLAFEFMLELQENICTYVVFNYICKTIF